MYDCFKEEMEVVKVATKLAEPVWMDSNGNIVAAKRDSYGCKCNHQIDRPDVIFLWTR